jgi:ADP-dependent NAD(P)H-hydrate dehydratase / NAD(P)H-hydrate epimerase
MTFSSPTRCPINPPPARLWSGRECLLFDHYLQQKIAIPAGHLMENAGHALASLIQQLAPTSHTHILHAVGPGNNGGDALVAARQLHGLPGLRQAIWAPLGLADQKSGPAQIAAHSMAKLDIPIFAGALPNDLSRTTLIVDGIFGVGLTREITGPLADHMQTLAALTCPSLAIDIASGLHADHGTVLGTALPAQWTLCMIGPKKGCYQGVGPQISGQIYLADIGVCTEYAQEWLKLQRIGD